VVKTNTEHFRTPTINPRSLHRALDCNQQVTSCRGWSGDATRSYSSPQEIVMIDNLTSPRTDRPSEWTRRTSRPSEWRS
jgi:hypothetical protein